VDQAGDGGPQAGTDAVVVALRGAPLFAGPTDDQLAVVAARGEQVRLAAGAVIARVSARPGDTRSTVRLPLRGPGRGDGDR